MVLANICSLCWVLSTASSIEHILPAYGVTSVLEFLLSLVSILAKNSTTTMKRSTSLFGRLMRNAALMQYFYNLDLNGRVMLHTAEDAAHPHWDWSALLHFGLEDLAVWSIATAATGTTRQAFLKFLKILDLKA